MSRRIRNKEWKEAAQSLQQMWLEKLDQDLAVMEADPPAGMKERLAEAYGKAQPQPAETKNRRPFRRPLLRWAAAAFGMLIILFAAWMAFDKTARAEVVDWMKTAMGLESSSTDAYGRLLRFLGGDPGERGQYRNPKGEAWRPYFGGAWLDGGKELVVALTDDSPELIRVFREVLNYDHVRFLRVKYSYDRLYEIYAKIGEKQKTDSFRGLSAYSLDVQNNRIEVNFAEPEEGTQERFLAWLDLSVADMFDFNSDFAWIIRGQEDQDLMELTLLLQNDFLEGSRLIQMGDPEAAGRPAQVLTAQQLAQIEAYMQFKVENEPTVIKLDKEVLEEGDLVRIAYRAFTDSLYLDPKPIEIPCRCGAEGFPPREAIQASVTPGRRVGETYRIDYTDAPYAMEETVYCEITLLYIYRLEAAELNDEFVRTHTEFSSVQAWREALIKAEMGHQAVPEAWQEAKKALLADAVFELDEGRLQSLQREWPRAKALAQEYLLIQAVAEHYGIRAGEAQIQAYADKHYIHLDSLPRAARRACELRALRELVIDKMTLQP
ncbi:MAG: hypothetical protein J6H18_03730 [Lachnospiraceae bacterium]|nr:hypothetical protein [Lachnospiraceae bacterium]